MIAFAGLSAPTLAHSQDIGGALSFSGFGSDPVPGATGAMSFSGWSDDTARVTGTFNFAGWATEDQEPSASLAFSGWADETERATGPLAFAGWATENQEPSAALAFSGWAEDGSTLSGATRFSGWALAEMELAGNLSFDGFGGPFAVESGALEFTGWSLGERDFSGSLAFAGCTRDDTIDPTPPLSGEQVRAHYAATDTDPNLDLVGNWIVSWEDAIQSRAFVTLTKGGAWQCTPTDGGCWGTFTRSADAPWVIDMWLDGLTIFPTEAEVRPDRTIKATYYYAVLGHWGGISTGSAAVNEISGEWRYGDESGREIWTRVESTVTGVVGDDGVAAAVGTPVTVTSDYLGPVTSQRGNRPGATLRVLGENLWGRQRYWLPKTSDIEVSGMSCLCGDGARYADEHACFSNGGSAGLEFALTIWWDAKPGRHYLYVNDTAVPFDLVLRNYPECGV